MHSDDVPPEFSDEQALVRHLRNSGIVLCTDLSGSPVFRNIGEKSTQFFGLARAISRSMVDRAGWMSPLANGLEAHKDPSVLVTHDLMNGRLLKQEDSDFWRHTTRDFLRTFVFFDVSDFSKAPPAEQLLIMSGLIASAASVRSSPEAMLCIGDGYVYAFKEAADGAVFSARLADSVEQQVAEENLPDFHFRVGVHTGKIRFLWDPGRDGYNYIGDGINNASRVLAAIGKEVDDVVFLSASVRRELRRVAGDNAAANRMLGLLDNKGRRADKHGKLHRVYQLNHTAFARGEPTLAR